MMHIQKAGEAKRSAWSWPVLQALLCTAAFLLLAHPSSAQQTLQVLHNHLRPEVAQGKAVRLGRVSSEKHLHLAIQLPLRNQSDLSAFLTRLYDRKSSDFRKYLSVDEFTAKYGPAKEDYQAVVDFVKAQGMTVIDTPKNRLLVEVDGTASQVEKAFHVTMNQYQHPTEKRTFYSPDREPSLELSVPLAHISGLNNFFQPHSLQSSTSAGAAVGSGPYGLYLPSDVRMAYYGNGPLDGTGQSIGLVTFWGFDVSDVDMTYTSVGLAAPTIPINTVLLGGLTAPMTSVDDAEPITDIVASMSIAPNLSQIREYQCCSADYDSPEAGQDVIYNSMASENICKQISQSAGVIAQPTIDDPFFEEMAAQGQSYFAASGDGGAPPEAGADSWDYFYPGDNAWVTSVGATTFNTYGAGGAWASEVANNWSGGGVSNGPNPVPIPSYQVPVINSTNGGSTMYRNLPDVAALGDNAYLCFNGVCNQTGGTSYSSPLWASFMALVNQQAAENNQPTVGFLNPIIYEIGQSDSYNNDFHDMIGGNNDCCSQTVYYSVVTGYDLVSGWGSPSGQNLINDLLSDAATPSFKLMASANTLSIGPSDSGTITILVGATGNFSGNVALTATGLPSGVTASFSPNPTTASQASVLTLTSASGVAAGNYTITITGISGSESESTTLTLTVTAAQGNFTVGYGYLTLSGAVALPGTNVTTTVTVTSLDNFASTVTLSAPSLPTGLLASFSPSTVTLSADGTATSTLTVYIYPAAVNGLNQVTISGASGSLVNSATMPLNIVNGSGILADGVYNVSNASSGLLWDDPGSSTNWNQPMTLNTADSGTDEQWVFTSVGGSLGNNYYQIENVASGLLLTVQGDSTTAGSPLAQWGSNGGTADQEWLLTASGSGYTLTGDFDSMLVDPGDNTSGANLVQQAASGTASQVWLITSISTLPDFSLTANPAYLNLSSGSSGKVTFTITSLNGYNAATALTISGLPSGVTAAFSSASVTPGAGASATSTLTLTASSVSAMNRPEKTPGKPWFPTVLMTLLLTPLGKRFLRGRRKLLARTMLLAIGLLFVALGPIACSNIKTSAAPTLPTTVTVTATAGPLTHTTTLSLYVH